MARSTIEPIEVALLTSVPCKRVRAGLLAEAGLVSPEVIEACQETVKIGEFDPDDCTLQILAEDPGPEVDAQIERRSGMLLRELLMAPLAASAAKRGKRKAKSGAALLLSQLFMLAIWGGLFLAGVLLLRLKDFSVDGFLDGLLGIFG
ncbi:MAG: hypothetical protein ACI8TQ_000453 [Planctomycetota bacterium]|jgi:hypothetical protein